MKRSGIVLMERDKYVFRYLFLHKLARITDLQADVFGGKSRQAVQRRIQKLTKERFLDCTYLPGTEKKLIYSLGQKALKDWIGSRESLDRKQTKSHSPIHDLVLLEINRWLKSKDSVDNIFTENGIRSGLYVAEQKIEDLRQLNSDLIIKMNYQGKTVHLPLEYERMEKFSMRYDKIIHRYYQNRAAEAALFICESDLIRTKISRLEQKEKPPHKFFYALLDDLKNEKTKFTNLENITLTI